MSVVSVLFPLGVRLSTLVTAAVFVGLAVARRDRLPLLAGFAWLTSFEALFQISSLVVDKLPKGPVGAIVFLPLAAAVAWRTRDRVHPDVRLLAVALVPMAVWLGTGFHLNGHTGYGMFALHPQITGFDATAEALNELAKTLWALAYLAPLLAVRRRLDGRGLEELAGEGRVDVAPRAAFDR